MGGRLVSFYHGFGEYDGVFVFEAPDEVTAASTIWVVTSPNQLKAVKTTALLSVEDGIEAMRGAGEAMDWGLRQQ